MSDHSLRLSHATTHYERLTALRNAAELSQSELARTAGIARAYVGLIESGKRAELGVSKLVALALTLGVSLDYLVLGKGEAPTETEVRDAVARAQRDPNAHRAAIDRALGMTRRAGLLRARARRRPLARAKPLPRALPEARPTPQPETRS